MPHWPCEPPKLQLPHELEQLVAMGVRQHGSTDVDFGRQPGIRNDANEYSVFARHDFYSEPGQGEIYRVLHPFCERLAFRAGLRSCFSRVRAGDVVVRRGDRTRPGNLCFNNATADSARVTSAHGERTVRTHRRPPARAAGIPWITLWMANANLNSHRSRYLWLDPRRVLRDEVTMATDTLCWTDIPVAN